MNLKYIIYAYILFCFTTCKKDDQINSSTNTKLNVGASANHLLASNTYNSLTIEIQYIAGFKPTQNAVNNLLSFLGSTVNKPNGINVVYTEIASPQKSNYTITDIRNIEDNNRTALTENKNIAAYFLFLDGDYAGNNGNAKVLGIAYRNTSMVIFQKTIIEFSNDITEPPREKLETTVINHEFGHILGLVNIGTDMQVNHQDNANGHHCNNDKCLMHYTSETTDAIGNLIGTSPIPTLDQNCKNDLKANGGK